MYATIAPVTTTLITGASGFLGREVLARLAGEEAGRLVLLLRARDERELAARLERLLAPLRPEQRACVSAVRGDVAEARLGLASAAEYASLVARVDRVLHIAATTTFDHPLEEARRINIGGTVQALELARAVRARGGSGRLDYVGTAFVAGDRTDLAGEDQLDVGQGFRNTYEQSKLEAEQQVRQVMGELPATILRPSIIVGDSRTGSTTSYKTLYWPMKVLFRFYGLWRPVIPRLVRLPVRPDCSLDVVPVDWVASAIAQLHGASGAVGGCYHLAAGPGAATIEQLVNLCCDHFGVARLRYLDPRGSIRLVGRVARPILGRLAPRLVHNGELMLAYTQQNPRFDVTRARAAGLVAPKVDEYFQRLVAFAFEQDFGRAHGG